MDAKTLEALGGKVRKVTIPYSRKVWSDKKGSVGSEPAAEVDIGADADADAVVDATYEWLKEIVKRNIGAVMREVLEPQQAVAVTAEQAAAEPILFPSEEPSVPFGPPPPPPAPVPLAAVLAPVAEVEIVTLDAPTCAHIFEGGEHRFKVFGGAWKKFGVSAYPEVLAMYNIVGWETWPVCKIGRTGAEPENRFALPGGFQKVKVEVKDNKPQRVHSFK